MKVKLLISAIIVLVGALGIALSYRYLSGLASLLSTALITAVCILLLALQWLWKKAESSTPNFGISAVGAIVSICTAPIWSAVLKAQSKPIEKFTGISPQILESVAFDLLLLSIVAIISIVLIVYILRADTTITGKKKSDLTAELGEIGFKQKLDRVARVFETRLTHLDDEANWTDSTFSALDAEIEKFDASGARTRKLGDLIESIRRDHKAKGFLVLGDPGSGKSVALRHLAREMLREVPTTGVLPIYINLKEWAESEQLVVNPSAADILEFMLEYVKAGGVDLIIDFCDSYLKRLLETGRLFIIIDSFDETPVLLDRDETSEVITVFSAKIEEFMIGPHMSRCVIASRYFRRPRFRSTEVVNLEILPLSRRKIRQLVIKSNRLTEPEVDMFMSSQSPWLDVARNPFVANLVVDYMAANSGQLPSTKVDIYENYIDRRLERVKRLLFDYGLDKARVVDVAVLVAFEMFRHSRVGLEASYQDLSAWIQVDKLREVIDILQKARLIRVSPYPAERISFIHRRFNEFFLAKAASVGMMQVDLESIAEDRRDRDALVLYVELAADEDAERIALYCWNEISSPVNGGTLLPSIRAAYCIRFLVDAFTSSKKNVTEKFEEALQSYLFAAVASHRQDMLRAKLAVEAACVLNDNQASKVVTAALRTDNYWIMETAARSSRLLGKLTEDARFAINRYIWTMTEGEFLASWSDLLDSLKLNKEFKSASRSLKIRLTLLVLQVIIRLMLVINAPVVLVMAIVYQALFELMGFSMLNVGDRPGRALSWGREVFGLRHPENTFIIFSPFVIAFAILVKIGSSDINRPFFFISINVWLLAALSLASISASHWARLGYFWRYNAPSFKFSKNTLARLLGSVASSLGFGAVVAVVLYLAEEYYPSSAKGLGYVVAAGLGLFILFLVFRRVRSLYQDWKRLKHTPASKLASRETIEKSFSEIHSPYFRLRLVKYIEDFHRAQGSAPGGQWSSGAVPNLDDRASVRLAQLEEIWSGLDR
jgi:hypothetical protein